MEYITKTAKRKHTPKSKNNNQKQNIKQKIAK